MFRRRLRCAYDLVKTRGTAFPGVEMPGHNLWPIKLVSRMLELAQGRAEDVEVVLHTHTPVVEVRPGGRGRHEVVTPRGSIECAYVVHATNGYANHLLSAEKTGIRIVPTRGQVIATRAGVSGERIGKTSWDGNEGFEYWFPRPMKETGEDRPLVILGGGREVSGPRYELYEMNDAAVNEDVGAALRKFLPGVFPGMYPVEAQVEWEWVSGWWIGLWVVLIIGVDGDYGIYEEWESVCRACV